MGRSNPPIPFQDLEVTIPSTEVRMGVLSQGMAPPIPVPFLSRQKNQQSKTCRPRTCLWMCPSSA